MSVIYGHWCPLCGKPSVQKDGKCLACGYKVGSDLDIDNDPVPRGGYPDELLDLTKKARKKEALSVLPGLGLLLLVAGLIVSANGGGYTVGAVGIVLLFVCLVRAFCEVGRTDAKAWYNRQRYWAYGEEPDWMRERKKNGGIG